ncbi:MAG: hypothetical protein RJA30_534, partial [Actinomycetota bacterium]
MNAFPAPFPFRANQKNGFPDHRNSYNKYELVLILLVLLCR